MPERRIIAGAADFLMQIIIMTNNNPKNPRNSKRNMEPKERVLARD